MSIRVLDRYRWGALRDVNPIVRRRSAAWQLTHVLAAAALVSACGNGAQPPGGPPPVGVDVAVVEQRSIIEWDEFSGRIQAVDTVIVQPRVTGYLAAVHFDEGSVVAAGDLLFTIDDREFRATVAAQQADIERAATRRDLAQLDLARAEQLAAAQAISAEEFDQRRGELRQANADLNAAQAALDRAQLDLGFTRIVAPIAGRVGEALIEPGNLVVPAQSPLTSIVSIDPIHVVFEGDERIYLKYQAQAAAGERPSSRDVPNPVHVGLAGDDDYPFEGVMDFVDNRIDPATGTIQGRAVLANPDGFLIPGLFARVRLLGSGEYDALLIRETAILTDQDRRYVYIVGSDNTAQRRNVELGRSVNGLRVVTAGLSGDEQVIVNGVRKVFFPGAPVQPSVVPMDPSHEPTTASSD
ncbi:MAG: efflux RND transporter periplasmic adaptor subunit [Pseudomonadota bacterium]